MECNILSYIYWHVVYWISQGHVICDRWHVTHDRWHMTHDTWHGTRDMLLYYIFGSKTALVYMWHVTCDTWHMTGMGRWTFSQNFSSPALMVWEWRFVEDIQSYEDISTSQAVLPSISLKLCIIWRNEAGAGGLPNLSLCNLFLSLFLSVLYELSNLYLFLHIVWGTGKRPTKKRLQIVLTSVGPLSGSCRAWRLACPHHRHSTH